FCELGLTALKNLPLKRTKKLKAESSLSNRPFRPFFNRRSKTSGTLVTGQHFLLPASFQSKSKEKIQDPKGGASFFLFFFSGTETPQFADLPIVFVIAHY